MAYGVGIDDVGERRTSLSLAFAIIAVAIIHRHGWFSGAFAWLKAPAGGGSTSTTTTAPSVQPAPGGGSTGAGGYGSQPAAPSVSQP